MTNKKTDEIPPMLPGIFTLPPYGGKSPHAAWEDIVFIVTRIFSHDPGIAPGVWMIPESREIGNRGHIHSFTAVRTKPPLGLPQPYGVGYVDLDDEPEWIGTSRVLPLRSGLPGSVADWRESDLKRRPLWAMTAEGKPVSGLFLHPCNQKRKCENG